MNHQTKAADTAEIFNVTEESFLQKALEIFQFQWKNNELYRQYCQQLQVNPQAVKALDQIPFLPLSFFKSHRVAAFRGKEDIVFSSSGTTGNTTSRHYVKALELYETSFTNCFRSFYGDPSNYAFLCLLPSYLEREGSSLIYMARSLVESSANTDGGFFLQAAGELTNTLRNRERNQQPSFLLGVTYALLDFAERDRFPLNHTIIMETGGMKGRRRELTRAEVHEQLASAFGVEKIHSEYGMTELLSQAYSAGDGIFRCPPWMKVLIRAEDDPFATTETGAGLLSVIDLANIYSCAFLETADVGRVYPDGSFEVLGRMDNSDIRGCSLLVT